MIKKMKLKGQVQRNKNELTFISTLWDGTSFSIPVTEEHLQLKEELTDANQNSEAVLYVLMEAQQDSRCYLTLPQPSLRHGHQVVVNRGQLLLFNTPFVTAKTEEPENKTLSKKEKKSKSSSEVV